MRNKLKTVVQNDRDLVDAGLLHITTITLTLQVSVLCPKIFLDFRSLPPQPRIGRVLLTLLEALHFTLNNNFLAFYLSYICTV